MKKQKGMTLPELMIAAVAGLFVVGAVLGVFTMSSGSVSSTTQYNQLQESGRIALRLLQEDIVQAGNFADLTGVNLIPSGTSSNISAIPSVPTDGTDCIGDGANNASFPNGTGTFRTMWAFEKGAGKEISCQVSGETGSDVIQIKRVLSPEVASGDEEDDKYYFINNFTVGAFYSGSDSTKPALTNGRRWEYQHYVYYVKDDDGVPSLYRHSLSSTNLMATPQPLVEGIEKIKYEFGVDLDNDGVIDSYLNVNQISDDIWDQTNDDFVLAVRVFVLVRSLEKDSGFTSGPDVVFDMPGGAVNAPHDQYRRRVLSSTIKLRNTSIMSRKMLTGGL